MKVVLRCFSQVLDLSTVNSNQLIDSLIMLGIEVENIKIIHNCNNQSQAILLEIITTPNRNDLSNIIGIAKEIGIILKQRVDFNFRNKSFLFYCIRNKNIRYHKTLNSFSCLTILMTNVKICQTPLWMQQYLKTIDCVSTNILLDTQTYIRLKWGLNISIFIDSDVINKDSVITVSRSMVTTGDHSYNINNYLPRKINIAGKKVISSDELITYKTVQGKTLLLHIDSCLYPNRSNTTETSDQNILHQAMREFLILCKKYCNITIVGYQNQIFSNSSQSFKVLKKNLVRILGPTIQQDDNWDLQITNILTTLNFNPKNYTSYWLITVPEYRKNDVIREIDIIEEVARVYGYNYFQDNVPKINTIKTISAREILTRRLRFFLQALGLYELVHSPFSKKEKTTVYNPLSNEYESLRSYLTPKLINSLCDNIHQGSKILNGFEIGKVFSIQHNSNVILEEVHLGLIFGYEKYLRPNWMCQPDALSWFQAKGIVLLICQSLGISFSWNKMKLSLTEQQFLHHQRTASLTICNKQVGFFGEINPLLNYQLNLKERFYICEINLDLVNSFLKNSAFSQYQLQSYSKYPSIVRDISIVVSQDINVSFIIEKLKNVESKIIKSIQLLNQYQGHPIPNNKKSLSFRVKYQSLYKTLTKLQITQLDQRIKEMIINELGADIRL